MPSINISDGETADVDLENSQGMSITAKGGSAEVYIDYKPPKRSTYTSAIKASAGYGDPFYVDQNKTKSVSKTDLLAEKVRVGVKNANISVIY